jgi:hypothetical protein
MAAIDRVIRLYINSEECLKMRLGQWFCFKFGIRTPIITLASNNDLFYETDTHIAKITIEKWLTDHQYVCTLPPIRN